MSKIELEMEKYLNDITTPYKMEFKRKLYNNGDWFLGCAMPCDWIEMYKNGQRLQNDNKMPDYNKLIKTLITHNFHLEQKDVTSDYVPRNDVRDNGFTTLTFKDKNNNQVILNDYNIKFLNLDLDLNYSSYSQL